jgi:glycosyltransferase involved in cell wall biosynthesis
LVHDVYPDILVACGLTSRKATSFRFLEKINRLVLRRAESIFCIGRDMSEHLARARGTGTGDGIKVIPLWADCEEIQPTLRSSNRLLLELGLMDKLVILYAGNMGHPHDIETLVAAIKRLDSDEGIHFLFIGSGPKRKLLDQMVACGSRNITLLAPRPRSEQNEFLNACDVAILSLVPGMLGLAVPSRTYNLMAAGKPIIALVSECSEVAMVVREEGIGWVVEPGDVERAVQALQAARGSQKLLIEMGSRARQTAEAKYSPDYILRQFEAAFPERLANRIAQAKSLA